MILTIIAIAAFGVVWADRFKPWEDFKNWIGFGKKSETKFRSKFTQYLYDQMKKLLNCYCISAWIALFMYQDIFIAALTYIIAEFIYAIIDYLKNSTYY